MFFCFLFSSIKCQLINSKELIERRYYDSSVNKIYLRNADTVEKILKTDSNLVDPDDLKTEIISCDNKKLLTMVFNPGDVINQFSQFIVEYNFRNIKTNLKVEENDFISEKGVRLGLTPDEVTDLLGTAYSTDIKNDTLILRYRQEKGLYFGNYYFKKEKLIKFWFGEEYP